MSTGIDGFSSGMVNGTPEDVRAETLKCLKLASPGGGSIVSTDQSLHDDVPPKNMFALIETVRPNGK